MAHPYQMHREHHKERQRVHDLYGFHEGERGYNQVYHRARGGKVEHHDEAEDKAVVRSMVKGTALKSHGHKSHHRADKRARGGKVKHKGRTVVNVNVAPQQPQAHAMPVPMPGPGPAAAAPPPPPRPPMPPPGGAPGMPPGAAPPMMGPRAMGGRIGYATGGPVEPHFKQGVGMGPKPVGSGKGRDVTKVKMKDFSEKGPMSPYGDSGIGGGVARKQMNNRAAKNYHKTPPAVHTPGMRND